MRLPFLLLTLVSCGKPVPLHVEKGVFSFDARSCTPGQAHASYGMGSAAVKVKGRVGGACDFVFFHEVEGGGSWSRCRVDASEGLVVLAPASQGMPPSEPGGCELIRLTGRANRRDIAVFERPEGALELRGKKVAVKVNVARDPPPRDEDEPRAAKWARFATIASVKDLELKLDLGTRAGCPELEDTLIALSAPEHTRFGIEVSTERCEDLAKRVGAQPKETVMIEVTDLRVEP